MDTIIVKIAGGLANQMVIYAAARALAVKNGSRLKLDLTAYGKDKLRVFELNKLNVDIHIASGEDIASVKRLTGFRFPDRIVEKTARWLGIKRSYVYKEPPGGYDENFFRLVGDVYVEGNFISRRYFQDIEPLLRVEFTFKNTFTHKTQDLEKMMDRIPSVGIHVRRGDYASNEGTKRFHGLLGVDYYTEAMNVIENIIRDPAYFVFSDDIGWARENLKTNKPVRFIDHTHAGNSHEDMYLMSKCKHNIISNSGFGYWGAWLNNNGEKVVVAPKRWFADDYFNGVFDLLPSDWMRI